MDFVAVSLGQCGEQIVGVDIRTCLDPNDSCVFVNFENIRFDRFHFRFLSIVGEVKLRMILDDENVSSIEDLV